MSEEQSTVFRIQNHQRLDKARDIGRVLAEPQRTATVAEHATSLALSSANFLIEMRQEQYLSTRLVMDVEAWKVLRPKREFAQPHLLLHCELSDTTSHTINNTFRLIWPASSGELACVLFKVL